MVTEGASLFSALLKHWRRSRGLSQLDLSLAADVSARHLSFLETGRAQPSRGMVLRLAAALDVPLRDQNAMLRAANLAEAFEEPGIEDALAGPLGQAVERMMAHQDPFPMVVLDRRYDILRANRGGQWLMSRFVADPGALTPKINAFHLLFDPRLCRPFILDWETVARDLLGRLRREALHDPGDRALAELQDELHAHPDVPDDMIEPDLTRPSEPTFSIRLSRDGLDLAFLGTVTVFSAPQNVTVEELRIESYFPADPATEAAFRQGVGA